MWVKLLGYAWSMWLWPPNSLEFFTPTFDLSQMSQKRLEFPSWLSACAGSRVEGRCWHSCCFTKHVSVTLCLNLHLCQSLHEGVRAKCLRWPRDGLHAKSPQGAESTRETFSLHSTHVIHKQNMYAGLPWCTADISLTSLLHILKPHSLNYNRIQGENAHGILIWVEKRRSLCFY